MAAAPALQVLTANRLADGEVVYWRAGAWVEGFGAAEIFAVKDAADAALKAAAQSVAARVVVNPYLFAVKDESGRFARLKSARSSAPRGRRCAPIWASRHEALDVSI